MSLNWDLTRIEDHEELCFEEVRDENGNVETDPETGKPCYRLNPLTEALIFATMYLQLGEITEANYEEFWWRARLYSLTTDRKMLMRRITDDEGNETIEHVDPSLEDVQRHIGLQCNVRSESTAKFMALLRKIWKREAPQRKAQRERTAKKAA
jgi:hypothetical protein